MKKIFGIFTLGLFLFVGAHSSFACLCTVSRPSERLQKDDAVFIGKVTKVIEEKRKWRVTVSKVLKGDVPKSIAFYAAMVSTSCESSNFKLNTTYLFFANKIEENEVGRYEDGNIPKEEREKIGNYEPQACSWTDTLKNWESQKQRQYLITLKDEKFFELLDKTIKTQNPTH